jgi:signal transduction histidine kinase
LWKSSRHWLDPLVAALLTAGAAVALAAERQLGEFPGALCVLGFCALVALRRWRPTPVAVAVGVLFAIPYIVHDASTVYANDTFVSGWAAIFLYCYALGSDAPFPLSLLGIAAILVGVNLSDGGLNPVPEMVALGPYAAGLAVASRRRASTELEQRARELEEEREIFATQSVRYERARIARELHDIVAHNVSLMVVQASAGERLAARDPEGAAEAFLSISEAAEQAEAEIDRLVELLSDTSPSPRDTGLRIVEELVARAQASGVVISCQLSGDLDDVADENADAAYRMVQEGVTNAMKHAPGAPIGVTIRGNEDGVEVRVVNGPAGPRSSGLEQAGGGHGLAGMRERVTQSGGTFAAGATPVDGWQLVARFPRRLAAAPAVGRKDA